ncbi:hypothetical protein D3C71_1480240 [compost metagenome]
MYGFQMPVLQRRADEDDALRANLPEPLQIMQLALHRAVRQADQQLIAVQARDGADASDQIVQHGVAELRSDHAEQRCFGFDSFRRRGTRAVPRLFHRFHHPGPDFVLDGLAVVDDTGDGRNRHPCHFGDIVNRYFHKETQLRTQ